MKAKKIFLSTEIKGDKSAWTKAKVDVASILERAGYHAIHFPKLKSIGEMLKFWKLLSSSIQKDSHIVIEFPIYPRVRMWLLAFFAFSKRVKIYAVIHDINELRLQETTRHSDMHFLRYFDGLISHNKSMTSWLRSKGYKKPIVDLEVFDYCLEQGKDFHEAGINGKLKILYAGNLAYKKATYIYDKRLDDLNKVQLYVYGQHFEKERSNSSSIRYEGMFNPNTPELQGKYHFGLIWEGASTDTCSGEYGQYIRFNNPHKFSLYISLGLPVIVWKEAAIASFVKDHKIGLTISSLAELDMLGEKINDTIYQEFVDNLKQLSPKVRNGFFLDKAVNQLVSN